MTAEKKKKRGTYQPCPLATRRVKLPPDLEALVERLAEHVHDVWACQRMTNGWTYGPQRNDTSKQHPNLVPYRELSEADKDLDRKAVRGTLHAIVAMGYRITKP